jgi:hypothetical protein
LTGQRTLERRPLRSFVYRIACDFFRDLGGILSPRPAHIVLGALALVAGLAVGCGGDSTSNPEDAAQAFYEAARDQDAEALCASVSAEYREAASEGFDSCEAAFEDAADSGTLDGVPDDFTIVSSSVDGDTATVETTGGGENNTITLVNEDGWKVNPASTAPEDSSSDVTDSTTP